MAENITDSVLKSFFGSFKLFYYRRGEHILRSEEEPQGIFYINDGFIRMYFNSIDGKELTINILGPGSYFPITWLICEVPNQYFFEAMTKVSLRKAPKDKTLEFIGRNTGILFALSRNLLLGMNGFLSRLPYLILGNSEVKVTSVVYFLGKYFSKSNGKNGVIVKMSLSHKDIACLSGLSRETTSLELMKLQKMGIIATSYRTLLIKNMKKLKNLTYLNLATKTISNIY